MSPTGFSQSGDYLCLSLFFFVAEEEALAAEEWFPIKAHSNCRTYLFEPQCPAGAVHLPRTSNFPLHGTHFWFLKHRSGYLGMPLNGPRWYSEFIALDRFGAFSETLE